MSTLKNYTEPKPHRLKRIIWCVINATIFRLLLTPLCRRLRNSLLRAFGAEIHKDSTIYASCKIYAPWHLKAGNVCIGPNTNIYNKAPITLADEVVISQGATLCTASHDITSPMMTLITKPITIGRRSWIASDAFINLGVTLGEGTVVAARAVVVKDVEPWTVVGGNPAKPIKKRILKET